MLSWDLGLGFGTEGTFRACVDEGLPPFFSCFHEVASSIAGEPRGSADGELSWRGLLLRVFGGTKDSLPSYFCTVGSCSQEPSY